MRIRLDRRAIVAGAALSLGVAVPALILYRIADVLFDIGCRSNWPFLFYVVVFAGWLFGGRLAAERRRDAPFIHGALSALASYVVVAAVGAAIAAVSGHVLSCNDTTASLVISLIFNALMAASAGVFGGLLATRRTNS